MAVLASRAARLRHSPATARFSYFGWDLALTRDQQFFIVAALAGAIGAISVEVPEGAITGPITLRTEHENVPSRKDFTVTG